MFNSKCMILCLSYLFVESLAGVANFIDKCKWDDKACLVKSSQKALPYLADGIPELNVISLDPIHLEESELNGGGLLLIFKDMTITGLKNCKITKVERNIDEKTLLIEAECPINVQGDYTASGKLLGVAPVEGNGPFQVQTNKMFIKIKVSLDTVDGQDGKKHWAIDVIDTSFEALEKTILKFDNLFNGDKEKAAPIHAMLDQSWKELVQSLGKTIVDSVAYKVADSMKQLVLKVSADELEL